MEKAVVCVTGGAGFLGQHIVKLLQEKADFVKEIRILDVRPYINNLSHSEEKPMRSVVCDLRRPEEVREVLRGVDSVIHTAGVVNFCTFPDDRLMKEVNTDGTKNVINACIEENVQHLVFTSTIDVIIGYDDVVNGDESLHRPPESIFKGYADTKYEGEKMVLAANGRKLSNGGTLSTVALRPISMYGEEDLNTCTISLKAAAKSCGKLVRIGNGSAITQHAYVGNIAWGHVVALDAIRRNSEKAVGHVFILTDDTPSSNLFDFLKPFLKACGFSLTGLYMPYPIIYSCVYAMEKILWMLSPICKINLTLSLAGIAHINKTHTFNSAKAQTMLGYKPIFDWTESFNNSVEYYVNLN